jgi:phytoene dehydrogenase-like protein
MPQKHFAIIGAGPGGLTAGMILAKRGYKIYESARITADLIDRFER